MNAISEPDGRGETFHTWSYANAAGLPSVNDL